MNTKRSVVFSLSFVLIIFFGGLCAYAASKPSGMILFYSISCPHCKQLESFIKKNDLHKKIKFSEKEITRSRANFTLLLDIMKTVKKAQEIMWKFLCFGRALSAWLGTKK